GLYASRKIGDGTNAVSDAFVRIPSENLDRSIAFHIALPSDVLRVRVHDCLAPFNGSEIRIRRSELQAWLGRHRKLLDRTKFRRRSPRRPKSGRPDQQFGLAINAIRELYPLGPPDLVGASEQRRRHGEPERPGSVEVDGQLELHWGLDGK